MKRKTKEAVANCWKGRKTCELESNEIEEVWERENSD